MNRRKWFLLMTVAAASIAAVAAVPASAAPPESKVTICHKPGTEDEATITVAAASVDKHLAHGDTVGECEPAPPPLTDEIIDADGTATAGSGDPAAREVMPGDPLTSFPVTGPGNAGLDMFDQDGNNAWTQGVDDLHAEGTDACPTAIRDGVHQLGFDCKVLDINGDLADGAQVTCDIEFGVGFSQTPCPPPDVKYHDANANNVWDNGEDIVLDVNNDGIFN